jgi:hypothetical protein
MIEETTAMTRIGWVRTILVAIGFAWAMLAWQVHERAIDRERKAIIDLIVRLCAKDYPNAEADRDECEINYRTRLLNGVSVNGNLNVSRDADDEQSDRPATHARALGSVR